MIAIPKREPMAARMIKRDRNVRSQMRGSEIAVRAKQRINRLRLIPTLSVI
jgi:hypothetical protein